MLRPLPARLDRIEIPHFFHPSSFVAMERCALSVFGLAAADANGLLTPHPTAFLGTLLHHVRAEIGAGRWGGLGSGRAAADVVFADALQQMQENLGADPVTSALVPLNEAVGRKDWKRRVGVLRKWAETLEGISGSAEAARPLSFVRPTEDDRSAGAPTTGIEQGLQVDGLRLRGRPDSTARSGSTVDVVEYKTGRLRDDDGRILESHRVQLQLYGLMIESLFGPDTEVRLHLEQAERIRVPWSTAERDAIQERLEQSSEALPSGAIRDAVSLANPGAHCRSCRLRPVCDAYLERAPSWWRGSEGNPRPLPLDVWGELTQPAAGGNLLTVRLLDPAGRRVRIDQLRPERVPHDLEPGVFVWFFDLEASEDLRRHGEATHPRNFHEQPPGPRWRRARRLRVFSSSRLPRSS